MTFPKKPYKPQALDYRLLDRLPVVGAALGPHALGWSSGSLARMLDEPFWAVVGRLREMKAAGLAASVPSQVAGEAPGWQRTAKGTRALERHQKGEN